MAKITLKPLDDGQRAVEIPVGKTTIGRGPFLGCSDKKVSRNHAVLEVTNKGEVFLTPTHVNPCFYQPTADSPGQILKKDIPHKLENGDSFSLLPRAFRYQLIVTGENDEKKDQNDLNKQTGKTNGAAGEGEEAMLNERNKDGKGLSSEDLNDANTVTEKAFSKDDDILANIDKNYSKEDNTFAKKIADIDDMSLNIKDSKETKEDRSTDKDKSDISKQDANKEELQDLSDNEKNKDETNESKISESCTEDKAEDKQKFSEKVIEENESTLGNDAFSKEKMENDHLQSSEKSESKSSQEKSETKKSDSVSASNGDEILDSETKDFEEDKSRKIPDWIKDDDDEEDDKPRPKRGRKRGAKKGQVSEKKTAKRKQEDDTEDAPPKTKSRKKRASPKFSFDEGESSSQRHTPGRTSSRTNRQTRQGLSLEDFIVSDDDEWQSDRSSPKPRKRRGRKKRDDDSGSDWEVEHKKTKKVTHKFGSGSESGSDWGSQKKKKGGRRRKPKQDESDVASDEEVDQPGSDSEKKNRIACTYGKKCYRRNQNHLDQFSHPGDSDYDGSEAEAESQEKASEKNDAISESEDDEGSKKECPFGANCFRKNPQHKRDFKHTKKVRPKREAAKQAGKKAKGSRSSDEVDSYDLNESLLNDDSDEYKPVDSGSDFENSEKTKRLAKGKGAKNKRGRKV